MYTLVLTVHMYVLCVQACVFIGMCLHTLPMNDV